MKVCLILSLSLAVLLHSSCSRQLRITADKPVLAQTDFKLDSLPESEINIPVRINLKPIYAMAEKHVDTLFTSPDYPNGWVESGCDTRYKYTFRRSPLEMRASGMALSLGFTGYYRIIGSTRVCVAGAPVSPWTAPCTCGFNESERRVNVSFSNSLSVKPDYKVNLTIKRNEPKALDKCSVCFWGQDITKQVIQGLTEELDATKAALEKNYGTVDLRPRFQELWNQLSKVYSVYDMGWLQMNPQRIRINNIYSKDDSLYVYLGLSAKPVISFERPADQQRPVPTLGEFSRRQGFNIFLDATLNYDSLSNLVTKQAMNKEFNFKKGPVNKKFIVRECRLYGAGNEKLIVKVTFSGTDNGTIYLTGKPTYTRETGILEIKNLEFDIRSKDALLKTADWLFNRRIITEISKYTRFDLRPYVDSAKLSVSQQLNHEWVKGVSSSGSIDDIRLIGIYPTNAALVIRSNCSGNLSVKVDNIDFSL